MDVDIATVAILGNAGGALIGFAVAITATRYQDVPASPEQVGRAGWRKLVCRLDGEVIASNPAVVATPM